VIEPQLSNEAHRARKTRNFRWPNNDLDAGNAVIAEKEEHEIELIGVYVIGRNQVWIGPMPLDPVFLA
jgi:hypothetical protein